MRTACSKRRSGWRSSRARRTSSRSPARWSRSRSWRDAGSCVTSRRRRGWRRRSTDSTREPGGTASVRRFAVEDPPQLVLGLAQDALSLGAQVPACPVDVEVQHRHGRAEWLHLPPVTPLRRALERQGDSPSAGLFEDLLLEVERITRLRHVTGPTALGFSGSAFWGIRVCLRGGAAGHGTPLP